MIAHNKEKINTDLAAKAKPFTMIMSSGKDRLWPNSFGDVGKSSFGAGPKKKTGPMGPRTQRHFEKKHLRWNKH